MSTTMYEAVSSRYGFSTNQRVLSMDAHLERDYPEETPLTTFLSRLKRKTVDRTIFYWSNAAEIPYTITGLSGSTTGDVTGATDFAYLNINDQLYNPRTQEMIKIITTKPTTTTLADATLTRGYGGTSAAAIVPTDILFIISPDFEEGSAEVHTRSAVNTEDYNYTGILQHGIKTTNTAIEEKTYFDNILSQNRAQLNREFKLKMELLHWFGTRHQTAGTSLYCRGFGGIVEFLYAGTNKWGVNGILTEQGFDSHLIDVWTQHPGNVNVAFFASPQVINIINAFGKDRLVTSVNEKMYGYKINSYLGAFPVDLVPVPMFAQNPTTQGWGFLLDMSQFSGAQLGSRSPKMIKNVELPYADYTLDIIRGEISLFRKNEKRHSMLYGIAA